MSYAEHGTRIFFTGKFNPNVVPRKRSEGRLKLFDSCTDLRAWSPNALDNCRYFREVVERPLPQGKIVPYDVVIENLIVLGKETQKELAKYKSLQLTAEQKKKLQDYEEDSSDDLVRAKDSTGPQECKIIENESLIPKRPETPMHSPGSSSTDFHEIEIDERNRSDDETSSDGHSEDSKEALASSETDAMEDDVPKKRRRSDRSASRYGTFDDTNYQAIIIEKDSEIIALKNELGAKHTELEELREICRRLESARNEQEAAMENLRHHLKILQKQLMDTSNQLHQNTEEWKEKMQASKRFIDHLKGMLAEKSQESSSQSRKIEELRERINEHEALREERDCLVRKLDEMRGAIRDNDELMKLNREQTANLADQEAEIKRLLELIKTTTAKYDERLRRAKIEVKNSQLSQQVQIQREVSDTISINRLPTPEIHKIKCRLEDDLHEVENELVKRSDDYRQNDRSRREETMGAWNNKSTIYAEDWKREKEFMECTIEQLTMQVSASNTANTEQDEIHKHIVSQFCANLEKIQRLIVELEPYSEERPWLIAKIKGLREALGEAQVTTESHDINAEKENFVDIVKNHQERCERYEKRIVSLTNKLRESQNNAARMEKIRQEKEQRDEESMDEKIDNVLGIQAKRSTEVIEKLSAALQGAGDCHNREMAEKRNQLEARNAEIAKLREQVNSQVSRGQGDQAERENSSVADNLKRELVILNSELAKTRDALKQTCDKLESAECKLKGSSQKIKELRAQCKKHESEAAKTIDRLTKENEGLANTVRITGELQTRVDEIKPRLELLQEDKEKLSNEVLRKNELCAKYEEKIADLTAKEMRATEALKRAEDKWKTLVLRRASEIEALRNQNETATEELEENKAKVAKLTEEIQSLKRSSKKLEIIENLMQEISRIDGRINKLNRDVATLRSRWNDQYRSNNKLEKDLNFKLEENEQLQSDIRKLKDNLECMSLESRLPETVDERQLHTSLHTISDRIEALRSRLNVSESEDQLFRSQIDDWREKSRNDASLIENLRQKIKSYENKAAQQDSIIAKLREDNQDLKKKLVQIQETIPESPSISSIQEVSKLSAQLENEMRLKNEEIEKLSISIQTMKSERQTLINEKKQVLDLLKIEKDSRQAKLEEMDQHYHAQIRQIHGEHNDSIKRLELQYEESIGKGFNSETWLTSLSSKEKIELHKRICASTPCEAARETSKVRVPNDKQNQQLQLGEDKLHSGMQHSRNGHHRVPEIRYKYCERRKLDPFEEKKVNFIYQCANQPNHESP